MELSFQGQYKSLGDFTWTEIPLFSVITGVNGSGKSQLLELIYLSLCDPILLQERVLIVGENYDPGEVAFFKAEWLLADTGEVNLSSIKADIRGLHVQLRREAGHENQRINFFLKKTLEKANADRNLSLEDFTKIVPLDFYHEERLLPYQLARIFVAHHFEMMERVYQGKTIKEVEAELGPKPWDVLNDIMREFKLPLKFNDPSEISFKDEFKLSLVDLEKNIEVKISDLSSGEKVLITIVIYLYNTKRQAILPRFLLMDEPDAHLHPSMTKQFLDVLQNVFVSKLGMRIVMTTHSPSTVALTPLESLFEMNRTGIRISKSTSKSKAISFLTAGLVIAGEGAKFVLVEDEADAKFYSEINSFLSENSIVNGNVPIVFIPASTPNVSGGRNQVYSWVDKLEKSGLNLFQGIIDKDCGNSKTNNIRVLNRYSIENYLLDPIIVYAALLDKEEHARVIDIGLRLGEEHKLLKLDNATLQSIANAIHHQVEPIVEQQFADAFDPCEKELVQVNLISGNVLYYPKWLLDRRGKTLLNEVYQKNFGNKQINPHSLMRSFRKVHVLSNDIKELFIELATYVSS